MDRFWISAACMVLGLVSNGVAACGGSDGETPPLPVVQAETTTPAPAPAAEKEKATENPSEKKSAPDASSPPPAEEKEAKDEDFPFLPPFGDDDDDDVPGCSTAVACVNGECTCAAGPNRGKSCDGDGVGLRSCNVLCAVCD